MPQAGGFICACKPGWVQTAAKGHGPYGCIDLDECAQVPIFWFLKKTFQGASRGRRQADYELDYAYDSEDSQSEDNYEGDFLNFNENKQAVGSIAGSDTSGSSVPGAQSGHASQAFHQVGNCGNGAVCTNTEGSYSCNCAHGLTGNPLTGCEAPNGCTGKVLWPKLQISSSYYRCSSSLSPWCWLLPSRRLL